MLSVNVCACLSLFCVNRLICVEGTGQPGSRGIHDCSGHRLCWVSCSDYSGKGKSKKCFQCGLSQILLPLVTRRQSVRISTYRAVFSRLMFLKLILPGSMRFRVLHSTFGHCSTYILLCSHYLGTCTDCTRRMGLVYLG